VFVGRDVDISSVLTPTPLVRIGGTNPDHSRGRMAGPGRRL